MNDQVRVKIRIEDATAEQAAEVFRLVEEVLDKVSPLPAEGLLGHGEADGWKYSYTVTPVGGAAVVAEVSPLDGLRKSITAETWAEAVAKVGPPEDVAAAIASTLAETLEASDDSARWRRGLLTVALLAAAAAEAAMLAELEEGGEAELKRVEGVGRPEALHVVRLRVAFAAALCGGEHDGDTTVVLAAHDDAGRRLLAELDTTPGAEVLVSLAPALLAPAMEVARG